MGHQDHPAGEPSPRPLPPDTVLAALTPFPWSTTAAVRYEVALEMLGQQIAACTAQIAAAEASTPPDLAASGQYSALRSRLAQHQAQLDPDDTSAIAAILDNAQEDIRRITGAA